MFREGRMLSLITRVDLVKNYQMHFIVAKHRLKLSKRTEIFLLFCVRPMACATVARTRLGLSKISVMFHCLD
jgi:hypothetical protein